MRVPELDFAAVRLSLAPDSVPLAAAVGWLHGEPVSAYQLDIANRADYDRAAELLLSLRDVAAQTGQAGAFDVIMATLAARGGWSRRHRLIARVSTP